MKPGPLTAGYSLLEILVVLVLIGLLAGITTPRLVTLYETWRWRNITLDVSRQINGLMQLAYYRGTEYRIADGEALGELLGMTADVKLQILPGLVISRMGVCSGGQLTISYKDRKEKVDLVPPYCQMKQ